MEQSNDFMVKFLDENKVSQATIEHFSSVPWTKKYLQDEAYEPTATYSRVLKPTGEDFFFSKTISTPITIPHYLSLRLRNYQTVAMTESDRASEMMIPDHRQATIVPTKPDCIFLLNIGERGIDGHPGVIHGGMVCAILDETMGLMVMLHHNNISGNNGPRDLLFTANLNVSFRAQASTPGNIVVRTWLVKREARKWYTKGQIVDQDGRVLSEGNGLWLISQSKL